VWPEAPGTRDRACSRYDPRIAAPDLATLVASGHTALVTSEVQENVVGATSRLPALAAAVADGRVLERIAALCVGARRAGVPVLHCTAASRPDRLGSNDNARLFALSRRAEPPRPGSHPFDVHPTVGVEPSDFVLPRLHGLSPMAETSLDAILRNMGITTIVATGVSVNVALLGLAFDGVNRGYQVVLVRDATAGVGEEYVDALYAGTLSLLATVTTTAEMLTAWGESSQSA
jgi:nicotinamidase-related amidase